MGYRIKDFKIVVDDVTRQKIPTLGDFFPCQTHIVPTS
jgi:hypothetical protein